jgi:hypothetical protein
MKPPTTRDGLTCLSAVAKFYEVPTATIIQKVGSSHAFNCERPRYLTKEEAISLGVGTASKIKLFRWADDHHELIVTALTTKPEPRPRPQIEPRYPQSTNYTPGKFRR